jgi:amidase
MALVQLRSSATKVKGEDLKPVLTKAGLELAESLVEEYSALLTSFEAALDSLPDDGPIQPRPDLEKYPRTDIHIPEDTEFGVWATKVCL